MADHTELVESARSIARRLHLDSERIDREDTRIAVQNTARDVTRLADLLAELVATAAQPLPTAEQVAMKLSLVRFSDEQSDRMIELTMREAWPLADAVVELLGKDDITPDSVCAHPRGFTSLRMEAMCCSDCGAGSPGRCVCGALYRTPQCQGRAHLHGPVLAGRYS